jgi:ribokinase
MIIYKYTIKFLKKWRANMSKFMVAGLVQMETIVKVENLPLPYKQLESIPDIINTGMGGAGFNEAMALKWLGNDVDFLSMVARNMSRRQVEANMKINDVRMSTEYILPTLDGMPTAVILYHKGKRQSFEDLKDIRTVEYDYDTFERCIQDKDMVLISSNNFCRPIIELAAKYKKPLAVNMRSMRDDKIVYKEDFLKGSDIIYISDDDLDEEPYEVVKRCSENYKAEVIIMGIGDKGTLLYTRKDNSFLEYKPVKTNEIVNTVGAGNALFSSFLHYYVKTGNPREAIKNALLFASYKIGFVGTSNGFLTEEQIEQWKRLIWK